MDEFSHAGIFSFDPNTYVIRRHASDGRWPSRSVGVSNADRDHLVMTRQAFLALVQREPKSTETAIAAWQAILSVYFAHWEE